MKRILLASAIALGIAAPAAAESSGNGLTGKITRWDAHDSGKYLHPLIVVKNESKQNYASTIWSCTFLDGDEPVQSQMFIVTNVAANSQATGTGVIRAYKFTSTSCRLIQASAADDKRSDFVIEQTAIETHWLGLIDKYQVLASYVMQNNLDRGYQFITVTCSLFLKGKLIGSATDIVPNIQPLSRINGSAVGATETKPDTAECNAQVAFD